MGWEKRTRQLEIVRISVRRKGGEMVKTNPISIQKSRSMTPQRLTKTLGVLDNGIQISGLMLMICTIWNELTGMYK